jgi:hypothetical protein
MPICLPSTLYASMSAWSISERSTPDDSMYGARSSSWSPNDWRARIPIGPGVQRVLGFGVVDDRQQDLDVVVGLVEGGDDLLLGRDLLRVLPGPQADEPLDRHDLAGLAFAGARGRRARWRG